MHSKEMLGMTLSTRREFVKTNSRKVSHVPAVTIALLCMSLPLFSQASQSAIQGTVSDQSGGVVAGANVSVLDVARGATRALLTDGAGQYAAANLIPGTYTIRAEAKGFQTVQRANVLLEVGQTVRVDLALTPGEQTQTVTVTSEAPAIDTSDAELGGTVSNNLVNALPLNGRNFQRLLDLHPGVVTTIGSGTGNGDYTNGRKQGDDLYRVEGIATIAQTAGLSGVLNGAYGAGDSSSLLPLDAIQEFNTEQSPKAEEGWKEGSVISIAVKSGTNSIHGTAYAFGRDASATDASNYFVGRVTPATLEQFGASAGGPIIKDKIFWFANFEGLRDALGDTIIDTIPTDISLTALGVPASTAVAESMVDACKALGPTHISPLSAQIAGLNPTTCVVSPAVRAPLGSGGVENLFPYNTTSSIAFNPPVTSTGPLNNGIFKGDYLPNAHNHISGMYYESRAHQVLNTFLGQLEEPWLNVADVDTLMYAGSWTWTPNSNWVNDFRAGTAYFRNSKLPNDVNMLPSNPWPTGYSMYTGVTNPLQGGLPYIDLTSFTGYLGAGLNGTLTRGPEGNFNVVDNVSYLRGKHTFKFGFEYLDIIYDGNGGSIRQPDQGEAKFTSLENFLSGTTNGGVILQGNNTFNIRSHWFAGFAQDDWRVTRRITLNLGLRYELETPPVERDNFEGNFNPNVNPNTTPAIEQVGPGEPIPSMYHINKDDFSPHVGVAWDIRGDGKTVLRVGASLMTDYAGMTELFNSSPFGANFPSIGVNNSNTAANAHTPDILNVTAAQLTAGWASNSATAPIFPSTSATQVVNGVAYTGLTCTVAIPCAASIVVDPNFRLAHAAEYNLDIQRAITKDLSLDAAYVGNYGFNEQFTTDLNQPAQGIGWFGNNGAAAAACVASAPTYSACKPNTALETGQYSAEFPYLSFLTYSQSGTSSNYNALQATANWRASHGLSFLIGYTYAHALGDGPVAYPNNVNQNYGATVADIRNRLTISPTYLIPGIKSPGQMLEGWSVTTIVTLQGGLPWYPNDATTDDLLGTGEYLDSNNSPVQTWNYSGPRSAFTSGPNPIPCYGPLSGCTSFANTPAAIMSECMSAAAAPYASGTAISGVSLQSLAIASFNKFGCYVQNGGILTPPAYGSLGNAGYDIFRGPAYYNVDFSVGKIWTFKERYSAQFRAEFFNLFNHADFASTPTSTNPASGATGQFGCSCTTPDEGTTNLNPVLGSGGPRHVQFGLKLIF
jgi:hypothetical protein